MDTLNININLLDTKKKLRSKKNVMVDGEGETEEPKENVMIPGSTSFYINANGDITDTPKAKMIDIANEYKPEEVVKRETGLNI